MAGRHLPGLAPILVVALGLLDVCCGQTSFVGCYEETRPFRTFATSAGHYVPGDLTVLSCRKACLRLRFEFAAMTAGEHCFCSQTLGAANKVGDTNCSAPCAGDPGQNCGSPDHASVWTTPKLIDYVTLGVTTADGQSATVFRIGENVTFTVHTTPALPTPLILFDYEGKSGKSGPVTGVHTKSYSVPGLYTVTAYVTDFEQINPFATARTRILVTGGPRTVDVSCDELYYPTNELLMCTGEVRDGLYMDGQVDFGNSVQETFSLIPVVWPTAGTTIPPLLTSPVSDDVSSKTYVQRMSFFDSDGELTAFEYYALQPGDVTFAILRPSCTPYCSENNQCTSCTAGVDTCSSGVQYCPADGECTDSCNAGVDLYAAPPESYKVLKAFSYTIPEAGWGLYNVTGSGVTVAVGDVVGYETSGAGRLATRAPETGELSDSNPTLTLADGNEATDVNTATATDNIHYLRAVASRPSGVKVITTYTTPGTYTITLTATSRYEAVTLLNTTTVILQDKISSLTLLCPGFAQSGVQTTIDLDSHTGTDITYTWWVDGAAVVNTTNPRFVYTFTDDGSYNVTVRGINMVSEQWAWCLIEVQDPVVNVQVTSEPSTTNQLSSFYLNMTSGSRYECAWGWDDGSAVSLSNDATTPISGTLAFTHTYSSPGIYHVAIECANNVSSDRTSVTHVVQDPITGISLITTGAVRAVPLTLSFEILTGTDPSFTLAIGDVIYPVQSTNNPLVWTSISEATFLQTGLFTLGINGSNLISSVEFIANFTVDSPIKNVVTTASETTIMQNESVTFNVTMDDGTSVQVEWDYQDGSPPDTFSLATLVSWPPGSQQSRTHQFLKPGIFNVSITVSNNYNNFVFKHVVYVYNRADNVMLSSNAPVAASAGGSWIYFTFTSLPYAPTLGKVSFLTLGDSSYSVADLQDLPYGSSPVVQLGSYRYMETGTYTVKVNVSNPISFKILTHVVAIVVPITTFTIQMRPRHVPVREPVTIAATVEAGNGITYYTDWGDGSPLEIGSRQGTNPWEYDYLSHTYDTVGVYNITMTASNVVGNTTKTYRIVVQHPVTDAFQLTNPNGPIEFTGVTPVNVTVRLTFPANGSILPSDASYAIEWGDGTTSNKEPLPFTDGGTLSLDVSHLYPGPGDWSAKIKIWNLASSITKTVSTGIYNLIDGVTVVPKYRPPIPSDGVYKAGAENGYTFPLDLPVAFFISSQTGEPALYIIVADLISGNGSGVISETKDNPTLIDFPQTGTYRVTVTAWTPLNSQNVTFDVTMKNDVTDITLAEASRTIKPEVKETFTFDLGSLGPDDGCAVVWFGNGDSPTACGENCTGYPGYPSVADSETSPRCQMANPLAISHQYDEAGFYDIRIDVYTEFGNKSVHFPVTVSDEDCRNPDLGFRYASTDLLRPTEIQRSAGYLVTTLTRCYCSNCLNTKKWAIFQVDRHDGQVLATVDMSQFTSHNKSDMYIPPRYLDYGVHRVCYQVIMDLKPFQSKICAYIDVVKSPLKASLVAGSMSSITVPWQSTVVMSPRTYSKDPDVESEDNDVQDTGLTFLSFCKQQYEAFPTFINGSLDASTVYGSAPYPASVLRKAYQTDDFTGIEDNGGCFRQGPGAVENPADVLETSGHLEFSGLNMLPNESYVWRTNVTKDDRTSTTVLQLDVAMGSPPSLEIRCKESYLCRPEPECLWFNSMNTLRLQGSCLDRCDSVSGYKWTFYRAGLSDAWLIIEDQDRYIQGRFSAEVSVNSSMFKEGFSYYSKLIRYRVTFEAKGADGSKGRSSTDICLNKPPTPGNCTLTGEGGPKMNLTCDNFTDPDGIATYILLASYKGEAYPRTLAYFEGHHLEINMPYGSPDDDYYMEISVKIVDVYGAYTLLDLGRHRVAPDIDDYDKYLDELVDDVSFKQIINEANVDETTSHLIRYAAILNADSRSKLDRDSEYYGTGIPPYAPGVRSDRNLSDAERDELMKKFEEKRDRNSKLRMSMIQAVGNLTAQGNITTMQLIATTMTQLTAEPGELNRDSQTSASEWVKDAADALTFIKDDISLHDLTVVADSLAHVTGSLFQSTQIGKTYPTNGDMKAAAESGYFKYDTNWYSERKKIIGVGDPDRELTYESSGLIQNDTTAAIVPNLISVTEQVNKMMLQKMVPGEGGINISSANMQIQIEKGQASDILGKAMDMEDGTSVAMPQYCALMNDTCNEKDTVSVSVTSVGPGVYSYIRVDDEMVPPSGGIVMIDLYDDDDSQIQIKDSKTPIDISIPRKEGLADPGDVTTIRLSSNLTLQHSFCRSLDVKDDSGLLIEVIPDDPDMRLVILIQFGDYPSLINNSYHHYAYSPRSLTDRAPISDEEQYRREHSLFLSNRNVTHFRTISNSDKAYFCVRQLNSSNDTELHLTGPPYLNIQRNDIRPFNVTTRTPLVSCVFVDKTETGKSRWSTEGMEVQPQTTVTRTVCATTHLSSFSSGWVVQPNAIDFQYVLDNLDFYKNPTLYVAEIVVLILYIAFFIWARRKDMKDTLRLGVTPLPDNDPLDRYYYEIIVQTGIRKNAATDSKVYFILSGEYDETDVRVFEDPARKIFRRGAQDTFLLTTERPLGPLSYARVWHDNSGKGKYQSWYLNYMIVHDLQTKERFYFIANEWFAVEESDGQIDRLLPVAGPEQMRELGHLLANSATKKLADDHIWFSVIARPPESRFTRVQRLSCCLCLLFTSMLANAMYYKVLADGSGRNGLTFGPFSLTPEQIYVGIISNMVVFPVNFLIVTLFRKSRPRRKRSSRLMEAIRKNEENTRKPEGDGSSTDLSMFVTSTTDLKREDGASGSSRSTTPIGDTSALMQPLQPGVPYPMDDQRPGSAAVPVAHDIVRQERKKSFSLPWWCTIVSWIVLWLATLLSATFVTMYGIMFGDEKTRQWITSMVVSFLTSIFLTQPIKVFLAALLFSLIFKKSDLIDEVAEEDEEELRLGNDETWLHPQTTRPGEGRYTRRQRKLAYSPPDPELLKQARENRIKEMKMYDVIREILFYSVFLWVLLILSYGFRDPNAYFMKENVHSTLTDLGLGKYGVAENSFDKILKMGDFWDWCENTMIPAIRAGPWYNGEQPYGQRGFMHDRVSRLMGYVVLRQLRIKKNQCDPAARMSQLIPDCYTPYSMWAEDRENYGVGWVPFEGDSEKNNSGEEWRYRGAIELEGWPFIGGHAIYGGGGYVVELRENEEGLRKKLAKLKDQRWITRETRAVFVELTVYNAFVNLFGMTTFIAEFINTGGIQVYTRVEPMNLLGYKSGAQLLQLACQILYGVFIIFFVIKEVRKIIKERKAYFKEPWNYIELSIILLSIGTVVIYMYRLFMAKQLVARFAVNHGNTYMKFQYVGYWNELLLYMLGWLVFLATVKFIRLLRFNKRMSLLAQTLRYGAKPLMMFGIMFGIIFFAYTQLFYFVYFMELTTFSNVIFAAETCMQMLVGKFNFNAMKGASPVLGPFFFFCYVVTVYYILINMFLTILNESFASVRRDIALQSNEYEMVEFIVKRFSDWTGISFGRSKKKKAKNGAAEMKLDLSKDVQPIEEQIDTFPERVDRLMDTISKVFLDQSTFESVFLNSNKARSKEAMKMMMKSPEIYSPPSGLRY